MRDANVRIARSVLDDLRIDGVAAQVKAYTGQPRCNPRTGVGSTKEAAGQAVYKRSTTQNWYDDRHDKVDNSERRKFSSFGGTMFSAAVDDVV